MLFISMTIANLAIHYEEVRDNPENEDLSGSDVFYEVFAKYWVSMLGSLIALVMSIFVFGLCGFHSYLVSVALTTQEKLKHTYDYLGRSPYSHGRFFKNWKKVVCWPRVNHSRLYYMLYLQSWKQEQFE